MNNSRPAYAGRVLRLWLQHQRRCYSAPTDNAIPAAKQKYVPSSGTYPKGFVVGATHAGVKASNTRFDDLALITSTEPCNAAGVFTRNAFKAAPVTVSRSLLWATKGQGIRRVVINSGCANAVTGIGGIMDAIQMAKQTDELFPVEPESAAQEPLASVIPENATTESITSSPESNIASSDMEGNSESLDELLRSLQGTKTLVMSTGVIGQRLPIKKITSRIPDLHVNLGDRHDDWLRAARAICTTDTFPKLVSKTFTLPSHPETTYTIAGMAKGAGMILPNMGTLLSVICTDAKVFPSALRAVLKQATNRSFNLISIDGDTSTNDTVNLFANGAACPTDQPAITDYLPRGSPNPDYEAFSSAVRSLMVDLAKLIVRDGEGATKFVTIRVQGAQSDLVANRVAKTIAKSSLVKTALYGKDANWGRIVCAIGYSHTRPSVIKPNKTSVSFIPTDGSEELKLVVKGEPQAVDEHRASEVLEHEDLEILVDLNDGGESHRPIQGSPDEGSTTVWTCDLSHEYVTINGDYRT